MREGFIYRAVAAAALALLGACGGGGAGGSVSDSNNSTVTGVAAAGTTSATLPVTQDIVTASPAQPTASAVAGTITPALAGWTLAWSDEFNTDGLPDPTKWAYDTDRNQVGWYNGERQYYARDRLENARVEGGKLIITARRENLVGATDYGGQNYTSARLVTRGKASWTYGFIQVRAMLPCGGGTWPAIWTLGTGGTWPDDGEIDLMEQTGANKAQVLGTIHTRAYNYFNGSLGVGQGNSAPLPDACTAFHNYQLTWDDSALKIGVDDKVYFTYPKVAGADHARWPFDAPQYLILNLAIGGSLGGAVDDSIFPTRLEIDHVRVYQR